MFDKTNYLIKEKVAFMKLSDRYDILDPETNQIVAYAKESISGFIKFLRLLVNKKLLPTTVEIRDSAENLQFQMKRPPFIFGAKVSIFDKNLNPMGYFKSRVFTLGGRFDVYLNDGSKIADVKGNWSGWNFKFIDNQGNEIGLVTKKWAGIGKELFTSADNYMISVDERFKGNPDVMPLLIMAGLAVDLIYGEKK